MAQEKHVPRAVGVSKGSTEKMQGYNCELRSQPESRSLQIYF